MWYKDGLKFHCTGCGKCCTGAPGYVWVTVEEIEAMAEYLELTIDQFARRYLRQINGEFALKEHVTTYACIFLDGTKCKIYPVRPSQCKTFPWWAENLTSKEEWEKAASYCEGINHPDAPLVQLQTIRENLS